MIFRTRDDNDRTYHNEEAPTLSSATRSSSLTLEYDSLDLSGNSSSDSNSDKSSTFEHDAGEEGSSLISTISTYSEGDSTIKDEDSIRARP